MAEARLTVASGTLVETTGWECRSGSLARWQPLTVRMSLSGVRLSSSTDGWRPSFSSIWWTSSTGSSDVTGITCPVGGSGIGASAILAGRDPIFMGIAEDCLDAQARRKRRCRGAKGAAQRSDSPPRGRASHRSEAVGQTAGRPTPAKILRLCLGKLGTRAGAVSLRVSRFAAHFRLPN
jgi:hypothetical protein